MCEPWRDRLLETPGHRPEGRLRHAIAIDQSESPILDLMTAREPLVGPGEDERAGDAHIEGGADLPGQDLRLRVLALAEGIDAELGQHQRPIDGKVLQPGEIAAERALVVQIDVEAEEVGEVDREVLGRREVRIAHKPARIDGLHRLHQPNQERAYALRAMPTHHIRRNLVADEVGEDRGMPRKPTNRRGDVLQDLGLSFPTVEKSDVLRPRNPHQHSQPCLGGLVQEPDRRHREDAHDRGAHLRHQPEIPHDHIAFRELLAV